MEWNQKRSSPIGSGHFSPWALHRLIWVCPKLSTRAKLGSKNWISTCYPALFLEPQAAVVLSTIWHSETRSFILSCCLVTDELQVRTWFLMVHFPFLLIFSRNFSSFWNLKSFVKEFGYAFSETHFKWSNWGTVQVFLKRIESKLKRLLGGFALEASFMQLFIWPTSP